MLMKRLILLGSSLLTLSACQTLDGMRGDMNTLLNTEGEKAQTTEIAAASAESSTACPTVQVMDELKTMIEFSDLANPSEDEEIARLRINDVRSACDVADGDLIVQMDITFDGALGPKARIKDTDKPSYAFPYFIAVTGPEGSVLSKEIFAASVSYEAKEDVIRQIETIHQTMPLAEDGTIPAYQILIGFQLSEEQLAYNRAMISKPAAAEEEVTQ